MLDSYFKISERGSSIGQEVRGGLVTFFTMAYIVALNPIILAYSPDANGQFLFGGAAPAPAMVAATTALVAGVLTILMGSIANYPLALATGLGLNTFVAVGIASQMTWAAAMGLVVLEGLIILVLVLTGFRVAVFKAVPPQIKIAISVGIGLFIALIGLVDAGFVRRTASGPVPVGLGVNGNLVGWPTVVFVFGTLLIIALMVRKVKGAILIGIASATALAIGIQQMFDIKPNFTPGNPPTIVDGGWQLGIPSVPKEVVAVPEFDFTGQFDLFGAFSVDNVSLIAAILLLFTLLLSDFFDTVGTVTAIGHESGLADKDGNVDNIQKILLVDSVAAAAGGAAGMITNPLDVVKTRI
jgi:AGZA family xanthine/uracil permease-like MFS transporter